MQFKLRALIVSAFLALLLLVGSAFAQTPVLPS